MDYKKKINPFGHHKGSSSILFRSIQIRMMIYLNMIDNFLVPKSIYFFIYFILFLLWLIVGGLINLSLNFKFGISEHGK